MKSVVFLFAAITLGVGYAKAPDAEIQKTCTQVSEIAQRIMKMRQGGVLTMSAMMEGFAQFDLGQDLVIRAFKEPRYSTAEMQEQSSVDFANTIYMDCIEGR